MSRQLAWAVNAPHLNIAAYEIAGIIWDHTLWGDILNLAPSYKRTILDNIGGVSLIVGAHILHKYLFFRFIYKHFLKVGF